MAKRMSYAAWARLQIEAYAPERQQEVRSSYYSDNARVNRYDAYKAYCKQRSLDYDAPPEGYWESKKEPWHTPAGIAIGLSSVLVWFLLGLVGGTTGRR
jgi:hypothetical protein